MDKANQDLISVCIPSYNSGRYIAKTIESVLAQTYPHFELIIHDDCSTDDTVEEARTFSDSRIRIITNTENKGLTANWNAAVQHAHGKYVKLVCGDDLLHPEALKAQVSVFQSETGKGISLVSCGSQIVDTNNAVLFTRKSFLKAGFNSAKSVLIKTAVFGTNIIGEPMTGLFRAEDLRNCSYNGDNPYMIDMDFWAQLLKNGDLFVVPQTLASFRVSPHSLSASLNTKQYRLFCKFIDQLVQQKQLAKGYYFISCISALMLAVARNIIFAWVSKR